MAQDTVDAAIRTVRPNSHKMVTIETLNSEMPGKSDKVNGKRLFRTLLNRLRLKKCATATISRPDPVYRVAYLGNVVTGWAKGEGCVEKPLATLWRNYTHSSRPDVRMQLIVCSGGLKATTKDHGLTEYWAHRLTTCSAPPQFPRLFCWVYRHEGRRLRHELRCHAVLCPTAAIAKQIEMELKHALALALAEFKRDKISKQNARLSLANSVYEYPTIPRRKILLSTGSHNYRPPLERSKSAPKLTSIEEIYEEEEDTSKGDVYKRILQHYNSTNELMCERLYKKLMEKESVAAESRLGDVEKESSKPKVKFSDDLTLDEKSDMILEELVASSLRNDLLETCERAWYNALGEMPDLIPLDSDETSLSSGCESATTDVEQPNYPVTKLSDVHEMEENEMSNGEKKTDLIDFKLGGSVLSRSSTDLLKYNNNNNTVCKSILGGDEVSLIPVGESQQTDFSSLKVYKKRNFDVDYQQQQQRVLEQQNCNGEEENASACSDESGYDEEEEVASSVANIILV